MLTERYSYWKKKHSIRDAVEFVNFGRLQVCPVKLIISFICHSSDFSRKVETLVEPLEIFSIHNMLIAYLSKTFTEM